jgi:hypothetical protein
MIHTYSLYNISKIHAITRPVEESVVQGSWVLLMIGDTFSAFVL